MSVPAEAEEQRQAVAGLTTLASAELASVMESLAGEPADVVLDALVDVLPALGDTYGDAASVLAADYFDEARVAAEVRGRFEATPSRGPERARWEALARWGTDPLRPAIQVPTVDDDGDPINYERRSPDHKAALTLLDGGLTRSIADRHRLTIVDNAAADPQARGWVRIARPGACKFCLMLADRVGSGGEPGVYTAASATFKSHDHCGCVAAPSWDRTARVVSDVPFTYSDRKSDWSDERKARENRRVYEYLAEHYGE